jgi:hypothetical protein
MPNEECEFWNCDEYRCEKGHTADMTVEELLCDCDEAHDVYTSCPVIDEIEDDERIAACEAAQDNRNGIGSEQDAIEAGFVERECNGTAFYEAHEWPGDSA